MPKNTRALYSSGTLAALLGFTLSYTQLLPSVLGLSDKIRLATLESETSLAEQFHWNHINRFQGIRRIELN